MYFAECAEFSTAIFNPVHFLLSLSFVAPTFNSRVLTYWEMDTYLQYDFRVDPSQRDTLIALLSSHPFHAFIETQDGFVTSIDPFFATEELSVYLSELFEYVPFMYQVTERPQRNWNALWEASFTEIIIDGFCQIRAPFHPVRDELPHQIQIDPRMAFGTGHHETTRLMIRAMQEINFEGKRVLDFGSGTGILAILASKLGASSISAIECDQVAALNLEENLALNKVSKIQIKVQSKVGLHDPVDIVLANITRQVLLEHLSPLCMLLPINGDLVLSGFIEDDMEIMIAAMQAVQMESIKIWDENEWLAIHGRKIN